MNFEVAKLSKKVEKFTIEEDHTLELTTKQVKTLESTISHQQETKERQQKRLKNLTRSSCLL